MRPGGGGPVRGQRPLSKKLLPEVSPLVLAGLLYLGAGLGLALARLWPAGGGARRPRRRSARKDVPLLAAIVVIGGMVSPFLMLTGLARVSGVTGSLLLNLEAPFTMAIAVLVFGEHLGRRVAFAFVLIVARRRAAGPALGRAGRAITGGRSPSPRPAWAGGSTTT